MPVRSLSSSVLKWPDADTVTGGLSKWAREVKRRCPEVLQVGYFGSYARGDWGVGSDLDLVVVVERSSQPFGRRTPGWDLSALPVPADVLVYTRREWESLPKEGRFFRTLSRELRWLS